jgi:hypothetical protein
MLRVNRTDITTIEDVPGDSAAARPYVTDGVDRDFDDWAEAREFEAKHTDYIGNLPGPEKTGTWLRFAPAGLNIVGEDHTFVSLEQTTAAVRSTNFIYERFATDDLPPDSAFRQAYVTENNALLLQFGVNVHGDLKSFGGESLLPKIADTVAELVPYFDGTLPMYTMTEDSGQYVGKPDQRYIKIGWAWAKDLAAKAATDAEKALVAAVTKHHELLDPFITALPVDGYLGDPLVEDDHRDKWQPLLELCKAYVPVMIEMAYKDAGITPEEQELLKSKPVETTEQQQQMFGLWRNLYFAKAVENAAGRDVRYAGMGDFHREWLEKEARVPGTAHVYSLDKDFFDATVSKMRLS